MSNSLAVDLSRTSGWVSREEDTCAAIVVDGAEDLFEDWCVRGGGVRRSMRRLGRGKAVGDGRKATRGLKLVGRVWVCGGEAREERSMRRGGIHERGSEKDKNRHETHTIRSRQSR